MKDQVVELARIVTNTFPTIHNFALLAKQRGFKCWLIRRKKIFGARKALIGNFFNARANGKIEIRKRVACAATRDGFWKIILKGTENKFAVAGVHALFLRNMIGNKFVLETRGINALHVEVAQHNLRGLRNKQHAVVFTVCKNDQARAHVGTRVTMNEQRAKAVVGALMNAQTIWASVGRENAKAHVATHEFLRAFVHSMQHAHRGVMRNWTRTIKIVIRTGERAKKCCNVLRRCDGACRKSGKHNASAFNYLA